MKRGWGLGWWVGRFSITKRIWNKQHQTNTRSESSGKGRGVNFFLQICSNNVRRRGAAGVLVKGEQHFAPIRFRLGVENPTKKKGGRWHPSGDEWDCQTKIKPGFCDGKWCTLFKNGCHWSVSYDVCNHLTGFWRKRIEGFYVNISTWALWVWGLLLRGFSGKCLQLISAA